MPLPESVMMLESGTTDYFEATMRRPPIPYQHFRPLFLFSLIGFCLWIAIRLLRAMACRALLVKNSTAICNITLPGIVGNLPLIFVGIGILCVAWNFYRDRN